jgi:hypothetical protein
MLATVLVGLSWPRLRASIVYLPVEGALKRHWTGEQLPARQLEALGLRAQQALDIHDHYRYWDGLSLLRYLLSMDADRSAEARYEALQQSIDYGRRSLVRAPAQPMTWLRIAAAGASLGAPRQDIARALEMSMFTGRVEPTLLPVRLELGYAFLQNFDSKALRMLENQTLLMWRLQRRGLLQLIRSGSVSFSDISQVLAARHPDVLADMESEIVKTVR